MLLTPGRYRGLAYVAGPLDRRGAAPGRLAARLGALVATDLRGRARLDPETPVPVRVHAYRVTRTLREDLYVVWAQLALAVDEPLPSSDPALLVARAYRESGAGSEVDAYALGAEMDRAAEGRDRRTMTWSAATAGAPVSALSPIAESGFSLVGEGSFAPPRTPAPLGQGGEGEGGSALMRLLSRRISAGEAGILLTGAAAVAVAVAVARRR